MGPDIRPVPWLESRFVQWVCQANSYTNGHAARAHAGFEPPWEAFSGNPHPPCALSCGQRRPTGRSMKTSLPLAPKHDDWALRLASGQTIHVPGRISSMTTYVMLEQERWEDRKDLNTLLFENSWDTPCR